jgi:hypothetical protein
VNISLKGIKSTQTRGLIRNLANYLKFSQLDQWDSALVVEAAAATEVEFSVASDSCCTN